MPEVRFILMYVCLSQLVLFGLTEASRLRRRHAGDVIQVPNPGNKSATSRDDNPLGSNQASHGTSTLPRGQTYGFNGLLERYVDANLTEKRTSVEKSTANNDLTNLEHSDNVGKNRESWFSGALEDKQDLKMLTSRGNYDTAAAYEEFVLALPLRGNRASNAAVNDDNERPNGPGMLDYGEDTDLQDGGSLGGMSLGHPFRGVEDEHGKERSAKCVPDYCQILSPCQDKEVCVMTPMCMTRCLNNEVTTPGITESTETGLPTRDTDMLRPLVERTCDKGFLGECLHGIIEKCWSEAVSCSCDVGWTGVLCNEPCTLPCVHGQCQLLNKQMFCACHNQFIGELCEEVVRDPEERPRVVAAVLLSALVVVIILTFVIPVIMWKLRVTFVLKLVYYFKEYEDEDGKTFDAYVSMTPTVNAENFVYGCLRPALEDLNFKLFLQTRDAPVGEAMSETILSALERSRRTIMIITRDYITNEWNRFEYLIAQHETLKLQQRIIPIILEDIDKDRTQMDKSLKHILDSIKCLKFPQAKPDSMTLNSVEVSDIQSPDSSRSADSTTYFYKSGRSSSSISISKEEQKLEKKVAKFWKHLTLTMPKKKSKENQSSDILAKLRNNASYDLSNSALQYNGDTKLGNKECSLQCFRM